MIMGREKNKYILNVVATMETHSFCFVLNLFILSAHWRESNIFWGWDSPTQDNPGMFAAKLPSSLAPFLPPSVLVPTFPWWQGRLLFVSLRRQACGGRFDSPWIVLFYPFFPVCIPVVKGQLIQKGLSEIGVPQQHPNTLARCLWTNQEIKKLGHGKS